jgi:integrase
LIGKTRKKVGKARIIKYVESLRRISKWLGKPLGQATQDDIEKLVCGIEDDIYKNGEKRYAEDTKADFKKALKKYYRWLGKPALIEFISLATPPRDKPALTREEAETMINSTPSRLLKAAVIVLFDGGLRIEEFLNLRMKCHPRQGMDPPSGENRTHFIVVLLILPTGYWIHPIGSVLL